MELIKVKIASDWRSINNFSYSLFTLLFYFFTFHAFYYYNFIFLYSIIISQNHVINKKYNVWDKFMKVNKYEEIKYKKCEGTVNV